MWYLNQILKNQASFSSKTWETQKGTAKMYLNTLEGAPFTFKRFLPSLMYSSTMKSDIKRSQKSNYSFMSLGTQMLTRLLTGFLPEKEKNWSYFQPLVVGICGPHHYIQYCRNTFLVNEYNSVSSCSSKTIVQCCCMQSLFGPYIFYESLPAISMKLLYLKYISLMKSFKLNWQVIYMIK